MSLAHAAYYFCKPWLPLRLRLAMRRLRAWYLVHGSRDWPILHSAARHPAGWPGWPGGKKFAFVLTHDVEGPTGLDRCRNLATLERRLGFRSSFNLVPEGTYPVTPAFRRELASDGFEVGVHDLRHDGALYQSFRSFQAAVPRINRYLQEWQAVGFRAGFMFHNLEWVKALNVEYDASTFDTDPFEPQPDGVGTIFPFWVARNGDHDGYVELPYTLPQDATVFMLYGPAAIEIWKRKLAWVASHGGMALVNIHPDYLAFDSRSPALAPFTPKVYEDFLAYVQRAYPGAYWHALPREVASFARPQVASNRPQGQGLTENR